MGRLRKETIWFRSQIDWVYLNRIKNACFVNKTSRLSTLLIFMFKTFLFYRYQETAFPALLQEKNNVTRHFF